MARTKLTDVAGIGAASAAALEKSGIRGVASLARAPAEKIAAVHGFGPVRAAVVKKAAQALARAAGPASRPLAKKPEAQKPAAPRSPATQPAASVKKKKKVKKKAKKEEEGKKDKKDKKDKKGKKGKKGKSKKKDKKGKKGKKK